MEEDLYKKILREGIFIHNSRIDNFPIFLYVGKYYKIDNVKKKIIQIIKNI